MMDLIGYSVGSEIGVYERFWGVLGLDIGFLLVVDSLFYWDVIVLLICFACLL